MFKPHTETPLLIVLIGPAIGACFSIGREAIVRTVAYLGADFLFVKVFKREVKHERAALDRFLDD